MGGIRMCWARGALVAGGAATVLWTAALPCYADETNDLREELRELQQQNQQLQEQLNRQQQMIDSLSHKVSEVSTAAQTHATAVSTEETTVTAPVSHPLSFMNKIVLSGEGGVGFFESGSEGQFPNAVFRVD